jgi:hypothetical protein
MQRVTTQSYASYLTQQSMFGKMLLFISIVCSFGASLEGQSASNSVVLFGKTYSRLTGKPITVTDSFSLLSSIKGRFKLTVVNGGSAMATRVSSARILLNGIEVVGPSDFSQDVATVERDITVQGNNTLSVELRSSPGSSFQVFVTGVVASDTTTAEQTVQLTSSGGAISLAGIAQVEVPAGATTGGSIQVSAVNSPYFAFLAQKQFNSVFTLASVPQLQIKSSSPFVAPIQVRFRVPDLSASAPSVVAFMRQASDGEEIDSLLPIGASTCSDHVVCATILPDLFVAVNPLNPSDPFILLGVGNSASASNSPTPIKLWTVTGLQPTSTDLVLTNSDTVSVSASLQFEDPHLTPPLASIFITSPFGFNRLRLHAGVDLRAADGTAVLNALDGVASNNFDPGHLGTCNDTTPPRPQALGYGQNILIFHGNSNLATRYAHLDSSRVSDGVTYPAAAQIALSDTDHTCAPHLHFEVLLADPPGEMRQPIDPAPLLPGGNFPTAYLPGLQFEISLDGHIADLEDSDPNFGVSMQIDAQTLLSLADPGQGPHKLELLLVSPKLGVHSLHIWNVRHGFRLSVLKTGSGTGQVVSNPPGIDCGATCLAPYAENTAVTLTAIPDSQSTFVRWSGDCSGTTVSTSISIAADSNCTAIFNSGSGITVHLNPFGQKNLSDLGGVPLRVEVINQQLQPTAAPQDLSIAILRQVISACDGVLFSNVLRVGISAGQDSGTFDSVAGRDPSCNTLPIVTQFTITGATISNKPVDLGAVPPDQLSLFVTR